MGLFSTVMISDYFTILVKPHWQASSFFPCLTLSHPQTASTDVPWVPWRKQYGGHHECDRHIFRILIIIDRYWN